MKDLSIDYNHLMADSIGEEHGLSGADLEEVSGWTEALHKDILTRRASGKLDFMDLPYQGESLKALSSAADEVAGNCENFVVLGIGGSALGTRALASALLPALYNLRDRSGRGNRPRLFVADNIDPEAFAGILDLCPPEKTIYNVISKSGGTAETMSQFLIVREMLIKTLGQQGYRERMLATTDPKKGVLRGIVMRDGLRAFEVPSGVGGRYSVFTAVGLLPLAVVGIDVQELLSGASHMDQRTKMKELYKNPAYVLAGLWYLMHVRKNKNILVMMPYASSLLELAEWFQQLWAESLGKEKSLSGAAVYAGSTPVRALGATDQHSQLQLYNEGPFDKTVVLIGTEKFKTEGKIPVAFSDIDDAAYLGGHSLAELITLESKATELALTKLKRPNMRITLPGIDAASIGQLMYLLMVATVFAGALYNVNPLDQPGVEAGKKYAFGMMGRPGFEDKAKEAAEFPKGKEKYKI